MLARGRQKLALLAEAEQAWMSTPKFYVQELSPPCVMMVQARQALVAFWSGFVGPRRRLRERGVSSWTLRSRHLLS